MPVIYLTSTLCGYLSCFQLVAIINSAVVNCLIQYLSMCVKKKNPGSGIARTKNLYIFNNALL